jgi:hypothetical protein
MDKMICSDPETLVTAFRQRVEALLERLQALGHAPRLHETFRTPARAAQLVREGKSKSLGGKSMHCYGVAADIICANHRWSCATHGCGFYAALGREARALGLTWGGDWDSDPATKNGFNDLPHVQAVPLELQDDIRDADTALERETIVAAALRS